MTNRSWRIALGAVAALCSFLLVQPDVQAIPVLAIVIGGVNVVAAFLKAPDDAPAG
jgi:hypothetical protein